MTIKTEDTQHNVKREEKRESLECGIYGRYNGYATQGKNLESAGSGKSKMLQPVTGCFLVGLLVIGG